MSCSITLKNISYSNENSVLFKEVSFSVGHEEKVAILGSNGVGKSTLLKIIAGIEENFTGQFELFHHPIKSKKDYKQFRREVGYLPQDVSSFFLSPTVIEDVMFSLRANGVNQDEAMKKAENLLEELEIGHLKNRTVFELSGGEQKIVALAGLLILEPKILLLDEPTNALDTKSQEKIMTLLKGIKKSMVIVSHHQTFIESLAHNQYELSKNTLSKIE